MKKLKLRAIKLWKDESGQGTAEYVLILVGVVGAAMIFRKEIKGILKGKLDDIGGEIKGFASGE